MCRLFGMSAGPVPINATFWLLEAPDSLSRQSHREPDGTGLGCFDQNGAPEVFKAVLWAGERDWGAREKASVLAGEIVSTRCRSRAVRE